MQAILNGVLLYQANVGKDEAELASEYKVTGYPTFVLVNAEQKTIARWMGYGKDFFLETMAKEMADLSTIDEKKARYAENPTLDVALSLARYSYSTDDSKDAVTYYEKAQELDPETDYSFKIMQNTIYGVADNYFTYEDAAVAAEGVFDSDNINDHIIAASMMSGLAEQLAKPDEMAIYLRRGIDEAAETSDEDMQKLATRLKVDYELKVFGDKTKAVELMKSTLVDGWMDDANQLNGFAWWCYENDVNLKEAEMLAKKAVDLSEPGRSRAMILDTVAHICKARGNMADAIKYMEQAVTEDPGSDDWENTLEEFKELNQES